MIIFYPESTESDIKKLFQDIINWVIFSKESLAMGILQTRRAKTLNIIIIASATSFFLETSLFLVEFVIFTFAMTIEENRETKVKATERLNFSFSLL